MKKLSASILSLFLAAALLFTGCGAPAARPGGTAVQGQSALSAPEPLPEYSSGAEEDPVSSAAPAAPPASQAPAASEPEPEESAPETTLENLPAYSGEPYAVLNGNEPSLSPADAENGAFETYSPLDALGRCGAAYACVGQELMPTEDRESIGSVTPSGWVNREYPFVDGGYLYNRCHLIGFQLTGENANEQNLITGTRYLNVEGMLPFENMVADYVKETGNHVLYRVTPVFRGDELVARGVWMEGLSVEDGGEGVCFSVYAYNVQPGVEIDYATGENWEEGAAGSASGPEAGETGADYILNTGSKKIHLPDCPSVDSIKEENKEEYHGAPGDLLEEGYSFCGNCLAA